MDGILMVLGEGGTAPTHHCLFPSSPTHRPRRTGSDGSGEDQPRRVLLLPGLRLQGGVGGAELSVCHCLPGCSREGRGAEQHCGCFPLLQDPRYPVENLLCPDGRRPWLSCPQERSRQLKVELQLERAVPIGYIDVGMRMGGGSGCGVGVSILFLCPL